MASDRVGGCEGFEGLWEGDGEGDKGLVGAADLCDPVKVGSDSLQLCERDLPPPVRELNLLVKHVTLQLDQGQAGRGVGEGGEGGWTWVGG